MKMTAIERHYNRLTKSHLIFLIVVASFLVYFNALFNGFVYDDQYQILGNRWITNVTYLPEIFSRDAWNFENLSSGYYRPLMHVSYMGEYYIFGLAPWGFHLVSIIVHAAVSVLVFLLLLHLLDSSQTSKHASYLPASIAALLFATHPVHTEAVTWIAGIPDVAFTFFYLLSFYLYIRSDSGLKKSHYILSAASFLAATFFKETALTLPFILVGYEYAFRRESGLFLKINKYLPFLLAASIYLILRYSALGGIVTVRMHAGLSIFLINSFPLFRQYAEKMLFPVNLTVWHSVHTITSINSTGWLLSFAVAMVFLFVLLFTIKRNKLVFLALLFVIVPLVPALYASRVLWQPFSERYLYLPSFGLAVLEAVILVWTKNKNPKIFICAASISVIVITLYSFGSFNRNKIWKDDYTLWSDATKKAPDECVPNIGLGEALFDRGETNKAIQRFQIALRLNPYIAESTAKDYCRRGIFYLQSGWTDKSVKQFQIALILKPSYAEAHRNLGIAYEKKGMIDEAIKEYEAAFTLMRTAEPVPQ